MGASFLHMWRHLVIFRRVAGFAAVADGSVTMAHSPTTSPIGSAVCHQRTSKGTLLPIILLIGTNRYVVLKDKIERLRNEAADSWGKAPKSSLLAEVREQS